MINLMSKGEHLIIDGLVKIIHIKASMNKGLNIQLKEQFTKIVPVQRPIVETNPLFVLNSYRLVVFVEA